MTRAARWPVAALALMALAFWVPVVWSVAHMGHPVVQLMMPMSTAWTLPQAAAVLLMWAVMMGAMMLPSTLPMVLAYRRISASRGRPQDGLIFVAGYLVVWCGFSLAATALQWGLQGLGLLTGMLVLKNVTVAGLVLIVAGLSQWTPLKARCLTTCRTPIGFFATEWRAGRLGAFRMGLRHGALCVGCCWSLMALLFVFGVMNLTAIGLLACVVAAEKLLPRGDLLARIAGGGFVLWGGLLLAGQA
jgi:predicted metal-binding membrane protein